MYFEGFRAEEFVYQKLDKPKPPRLTESEALGQSMIEAGNDFGPGTSYGTLHGLWCFTLKKKKKKANKQITTNLRSVPYFGQRNISMLKGYPLKHQP